MIKSMTKPLFTFPFKENIYRVIDGDTVAVTLDRGWRDYKETSLRFGGLNAPESRTRRVLEKQAGLLVKKLVIRWFELRKDKIFYGTSDARPKFFGRTIGRIWADDANDCINQYLLNLKVVKVYNGGKREKFSGEDLNTIIEICNKELQPKENISDYTKS